MKTPRRLLPILLLVVLAACGARLAARQDAAAGKQTFQVAMRDGTTLATDVYRPAGDGGFPTIMLRTPYNKDGGAAIGAEGAKRGYAVVIQDTRGRFASQGRAIPFDGDGWWEDRWDGFDTLEWIGKQPWSRGKVATMGGSALGITQLFAAGTGTDRLACQQVHVGAPRYYGAMVYTGGVFRKSMIEDWLKATGHDPETLALWTSHPSNDAYWRERDLTRRWEKVNTPAIHVGGWYDIFAQATIDAFQGYQKEGGPHARGQQKLLMGPWTHGIFQDQAGELSFRNGRRPTNNVGDPWRWFDHYLKEADTGIEREAAVTYYVMGDAFDAAAPGNTWRTAPTWPPPGMTPTPYYLHADRSLSPEKPGEAQPLTYSYDPKDPCPTTGGPQLTLPSGPRNQAAVEARPDVLVFTGAPLNAPLEVTGPVSFHCWAASDAPDTDFVARLCDVYPDGRSFNVCEGILRARYRDGFEREQLMEAGKVYEFKVDLWSTSLVFNKGHRLRLQVTSSCSPGWDPNPNTGDPFRANTRTRPARNTLYLDAQRPSHLLLPVMAGAG